MSATEKEQESKLKAYPMRWLVLAISFFNSVLRCLCQSCYGPINNVLVRLLRVHSWQIDWLVIVQSIVLMVMGIPMSWMTIRFGFRKSLTLMSAFLAVGFSLILAGVWVKGGYYFMLAGQAINSLSVLIGIGLVPLIAALWFPANEVAIAVGIQLFARGTGEALGSAIPSLLVNMHQSRSEMRLGLTIMFAPLIVIAAILTLISVFVPQAPILPPSVAQLKKQRAEIKEEISLKESVIRVFAVAKKVILSPRFIVVSLVSSILGPLLRCYTILLSSMLHKNFHGEPHLNKNSGFVLLGSWCLFTVSALAMGPIIAKSKRYRAVMVLSSLISSVACSLVCLGINVHLIALVYTGVLLIGVGVGSVNTCMFELLVEVTYPISPHLVLSLHVLVMGCFRMTYPIVMRALLTKYGSAVASVMPALFSIIALLVIASIPIRFKRLEAENSPETAPLLE